MPNPFLPPGSEDQKGSRSAVSDKVFAPAVSRRGGSLGGAARKVQEERKVAEQPEATEGYNPPPAPSEEKPKQEGLVKLLNPKWADATGIFNEVSKAIVEAEIPESLKNITRVSFTLYAPLPEGEDDRIVATEGHIKDGKATADLTMYHSSCRHDIEDYESAEYYFTAKHRDSKEVKSPPFRVWKKYDSVSIQEAQDIALQITREFEKTPGKGEGFDSLAGNFDGAGVSYGIMQWCIKWGTLQKLLKQFRDADEAAFKACFVDKNGKEVESALKKIDEVITEKQTKEKDEDGNYVHFEGHGMGQGFPHQDTPPLWMDRQLGHLFQEARRGEGVSGDPEEERHRSEP